MFGCRGRPINNRPAPNSVHPAKIFRSSSRKYIRHVTYPAAGSSVFMPLSFLFLFLAVEIVPTHPDVVYQQPQIASDGQSVGIVFGAKNTIYYAHNDASPIVVAEAPALSLGNHRGPRLA